MVRRGYRAIAAIPGVAYCLTFYCEGHNNRPSGYPRSQLEYEESSKDCWKGRANSRTLVHSEATVSFHDFTFFFCILIHGYWRLCHFRA